MSAQGNALGTEAQQHKNALKGRHNPGAAGPQSVIRENPWILFLAPPWRLFSQEIAWSPEGKTACNSISNELTVAEMTSRPRWHGFGPF